MTERIVLRDVFYSEAVGLPYRVNLKRLENKLSASLQLEAKRLRNYLYHRDSLSIERGTIRVLRPQDA